jgi:hypothetical protein
MIALLREIDCVCAENVYLASLSSEERRAAVEAYKVALTEGLRQTNPRAKRGETQDG